MLGQSEPLRRERDSLRPLNADKKSVTSNNYPASELTTSVFSQDFGRKKLTYAPVASPPMYLSLASPASDALFSKLRTGLLNRRLRRDRTR